MNESNIMGGNFFLTLSKGQMLTNNMIKASPFPNLDSLNLMANSNNKMVKNSNAKANTGEEKGMGDFITKGIQRVYEVLDIWLEETVLKSLRKSGEFFVKGHIKPFTILPEFLMEMAKVQQKKGEMTDYLNAAKKTWIRFCSD